MSRQYHQQTNNKITAIAVAQSTTKVDVVWLAALAAFIIYFFSFFFSSIEWRALAEP